MKAFTWKKECGLKKTHIHTIYIYIYNIYIFVCSGYIYHISYYICYKYIYYKYYNIYHNNLCTCLISKERPSLGQTFKVMLKFVKTWSWHPQFPLSSLFASSLLSATTWFRNIRLHVVFTLSVNGLIFEQTKISLF